MFKVENNKSWTNVSNFLISSTELTFKTKIKIQIVWREVFQFQLTRERFFFGGGGYTICFNIWFYQQQTGISTSGFV